MTNIIQIKRSTTTATPPASTLKHGELSLNQVGGVTKLHIGNSDNTTSKVLIPNAEQLNNFITTTASTGGQLKGVASANGSYSNVYFVNNENVDPDANADSSLGFIPGSLWFNPVSNKLWSAQDTGAGAAVWSLVTSPLTSPLTFKGNIDASSNPNYPASTVGDVYRINVAGKIGGASGVNVEQFDQVLCISTTPSGNQATVGANFNITQANIDGAVVSSSTSSTTNNIAVFDGATGKMIKDSGKQYSATSTASTLVDRDANSRISANGLIPNVNVVTTLGANFLTLSNASVRSISFQNDLNGDLGNGVALPDATTLSLGDIFSFYNGASGLLEIYEHDVFTVKATLQQDESVTVKLVDNSNAFGIWKYLREEASFNIIDGGVY
jgi:hypothetical protein